MRLLIDENLAPRIASLLNDAGHNAVHVRDFGAAGAPDTRIIDLVLANGRTIVSADADFGAVLASTEATGPSVILVREVVGHRPTDLVGLLVVMHRAARGVVEVARS